MTRFALTMARREGRGSRRRLAFAAGEIAPAEYQRYLDDLVGLRCDFAKSSKTKRSKFATQKEGKVR